MNDIPIFTIWLTDEDWGAMPYLYEICIASWQVLNPNRKVTIYANHPLHLSFLDRTITEVRQLDSCFPGLYENAAEISDLRAHQSDFIRFSILKEQTGIYLDTDVLCYKCIDDFLDEIKDLQSPITFCLEDDNMICNACIVNTNVYNSKEVFNDILNNYNKRYIKHSYLFNSQKYLWLMYRRYGDKILLANPSSSIFNVSWKLTEDDKKLLLNAEDIKSLDGFGYHLYSSNKKWDDMRKYIDNNLYNKYPQNFIQKLTKYIIDEYINLMKETDSK